MTVIKKFSMVKLWGEKGKRKKKLIKRNLAWEFLLCLMSVELKNNKTARCRKLSCWCLISVDLKNNRTGKIQEV